MPEEIDKGKLPASSDDFEGVFGGANSDDASLETVYKDLNARTVV
jgi:hypothetical protein